MALPVIDTNILVRYLTKDEPVQSPKAQAYIDQLDQGTLQATSCEGVLVETIQVLSSKNLYNVPRTLIAQYLTRFLSLKGLKMHNKRTYLRALALYETTNISFVDALAIAHSEREGSHTVISFDKGLDKVGGISRQEP